MDKTYIIATLERKHDALAESHARLMEALEEIAHRLHQAANGGLTGRYGTVGHHKDEEREVRNIARAALDKAPKL